MNRTRGGSDVMYDGPGLWAFVNERVENQHRELTDNLDRAMRRWREGERASEEVVDRLCCHLGWGSHLTAIPHDLIIKGRHLIDPEYQEAA